VSPEAIWTEIESVSISPEEQPIDLYGTGTRKAAADLTIRPEINEHETLHVYELDP
jgi:hypothetical protein